MLLDARYSRFYERDRRPDQRRAAARDRDRVLYSSALRRLGHVTQVASPTEGIVFHNRLTHSHEVAQIGRRVAERLTSTEEGRRKAERLGGVDPDVVETASLVHDLGHPPHGHAVEKELDRIVAEKYGVHDGYESNAQSFRIVNKLAMRSWRVPGLNLTRASLDASLKYPWLRAGEDGRKRRKWGVYSTEAREFEWVREGRIGSEDAPGVEAEIMDWADDVAYAVHDVDDFYRAGLVPLDRLRNRADHEVGRFARYASRTFGREEEEIRDALHSVIAASPIVELYVGTDEQRQQLRTFTAGLINVYVNCVELADDPEESPLVKIPDHLRTQVDVLKQLTWFYVIDSHSIKVQHHGQRRVVSELFDIYLRASVSDDREMRGVLPESQQRKMSGASGEVERVRLVADLISSMTERRLMTVHRKLTGADPGSITDLI